MKTYKAIGLMSGTSLDGLDIVYCHFTYTKSWQYKIVDCTALEYSKEWKAKLGGASDLNGKDLTLLHKQYGEFLGKTIYKFIQDRNIEVDFIASHGHTVFHQPDKKLTLQIGDGHEIAVNSGVTTICDFRSLDVALGGQGAPLVPIGDQLLFSDYDYCLNLGGFANISFEENNTRYAYDICPVNIILNYLTRKTGHDFDKNGALGLLGKTNTELLQKLNALDYYKKSYPKTLGREWLEAEILPLLNETELSVHDKLRTLYEHIAIQISQSISKKDFKVFITGGGAYNKLLVNLIKQKISSEIVIPDKNLIDYKEALIFALLGVLKMEEQVNCLASVTGASKDSCGGVVYSNQY
ncbi:MAG: anhydro-N-acetylmuramic acid kinase [Bacteroidetes bacterium]|nr:anhydro-N-acetylmuramic acid kinase [Bacteroidota bacterium]